MLEYLFKNVHDVMKLDRREEGSEVVYSLTVSLSLPPRVFYQPVGRGDPHIWSKHPTTKDWNWDGKKRLAFAHIGQQELATFFQDLSHDQQQLFRAAPDTGILTDHRYEFRFTRSSPVHIGDEEDRFLKMLTTLQEHGMIVSTERFANIQVISKDMAPQPFDVRGADLHFDVLYKVLGMISFNVINEYVIDEEFVELLKSKSPQVMEHVLDAMTHGTQKKRIWKPAEALKEWLRDVRNIQMKLRKRDDKDHNSRYTRKLIITPTKVYYDGPQLELPNRIVRHYNEYADRFMRVTFCHDDFGKVRGNFEVQESMFKRIEAVLDEGVEILDHHYRFLQYSNSQLKVGGCWFFASVKGGIDEEEIAKAMGNFEHIRNPALLGARRALCLSSTHVIGRVSDSNIKSIPDVERTVDGVTYVFSDGVGKMGVKVARRIGAQWPKLRTDNPSAVQFRQAGSKGVLTLDKNIPPDEIHIRPSQNKFESNHPALEICRLSFYSPGYLNRQFVFIDIKDAAMASLDSIEEDAEFAIKILMENNDEHGVASMLIDLIKAGFYESRDPYLINLLRLFKAIQLKGIKRRSRLHVPKSCHLLGVMDETGLLKEGEVFCQFTVPESPGNEWHGKPRKEIIRGTDGAVGRSPALHPGDIRRVMAVDIPELHHLCDVVVFSQHGDRPLPNQLSGGDLDGDTFWITWDEHLISKKVVEPMTYTTEKPPDEDRKIGVKDIQKHFVKYLMNDNLGAIANTHLAVADQDGADCPKALRLAELHSDAVDFAKKGKPAIVDAEDRVKIYPDFMEKRDKPSYESRKANGEIYRSVKVEMGLEKEFRVDERLMVEGWEEFVEDARDVKCCYDLEVWGLMRQYGIKSEFELVSGYLFKLDEGIKKKPQELKDQVLTVFATLKQKYRREFFFTLPSSDPSLTTYRTPNAFVPTNQDIPDIIRRKAYAWYYVTYAQGDVRPRAASPPSRERGSTDEGQADAARRRKEKVWEYEGWEYEGVDLDMGGRMVSFCWVLHDVLCNLLVAKTRKEKARGVRGGRGAPVPAAAGPDVTSAAGEMGRRDVRASGGVQPVASKELAASGWVVLPTPSGVDGE
ncbi:hypothetical protein HDV00_002146 [Rhizophlyctis rosea]|nr:hypothetical protein HDV00_002146 [Rhizophlyctis rosea]